jgi:endonuclease/exonuclease/phosphatase family metal-dependent hydrolase
MNRLLFKCFGCGGPRWSNGGGWKWRKRNQIAPLPQSSRFILGTWNLEQLNCKHAVKLGNIAETILESEAHLVAVQEVSDQKSLDTLCSKLGTSWSYITHRRPLNTSRPYEYGSFVYHMDRVKPLGMYASTFDHETMHMYVGKHKLMQRSPFMCKFMVDGNTEIVIVSVHAKAKTTQCGPVRDIYALWDIVSRWHMNGERVFIVGDFNTGSDDISAFCRLRHHGGYVPALEDPRINTNVIDTQQYDNIWSTQRVAGGDVCVYRHAIPQPYDRTTYPNHCLVTATFDISSSKHVGKQTIPLYENLRLF